MRKKKLAYVGIALPILCATYFLVVVRPNIHQRDRFRECEKSGNILDSNPPQCANEICPDLNIVPDCGLNSPVQDVRSIWLP